MAKGTRKCVSCGRELPEDVSFCLACGTPQSPRAAAAVKGSSALRLAILISAAVLALAGGVLAAVLLLRSPSEPPEEPSGPDAVLETTTGKDPAETETEPGTQPATEPQTTAETKETKDVKTDEPATVPETTAPVTTQIPAHTHNYSERVTKAATCTGTGVLTRTCTVCGRRETQTIPAKGHEFSVTEEKASTCVEAGRIVRTCAVCGERETETLPLAEHSFTLTSGTAATCTAASENAVYTCPVCGKPEERNEAALGHTTDDGVCARCGLLCHGDVTIYWHENYLEKIYSSGSVRQRFYIDQINIYSDAAGIWCSGIARTVEPANYDDKALLYIYNSQQTFILLQKPITVIPAGPGAEVVVPFDNLFLVSWDSLSRLSAKDLYLYMGVID